MMRFSVAHKGHQQHDETNAGGQIQTAGMPVAAAMPPGSLRIINHELNERKTMKALARLLAALAIAMLAACSNLPMSQSAQSGQVQHPDVFHSYID